MYKIKVTQLSNAINISPDDKMEIIDIDDPAMCESGTNKQARVGLIANAVAKNITDNVVIDVNTTLNPYIPAVKITQNGPGDVLLIEDSPSPDSTAFLIDHEGKVIMGGRSKMFLDNIYNPNPLAPKVQIQATQTDNASLAIFHCQDEGAAGVIHYAKSRGNLDTPLRTNRFDQLGAFTYQAHDGTEFLEAARTWAMVDQEITTGSVNAAFIIGTRSPTDTEIQQRVRVTSSGNVGVGLRNPVHLLELNIDSAAKPSSSTWTVSSDERLKENIELADLNLCYDAVKNIPLKRYKWKDQFYSAEQIADRNKIGWIAQDVQSVFPKAVEQKRFSYNVVTNDTGAVLSEEAIEDCLTLNSDQIYAAMFGAIQKLIEKVENLEQQIAQMQAD